ncbi:MAG: Lrp/AsnC ligand binding domain-containing protein, partial [Candidatus Hermodarchaeota archaeon]
INKYYKIPRALLKMSISFISGVIILVPISFLLTIIPIKTDMTQEAISFFNDITVLFDILSRWEIIYLIIFATILPYLLIFLAKVNWRSTNLTYSQWSSIIGLIDPISTLIFSVLLVSEFFPYEYLIIVIVFLIITIVLRYAHEVRNIVHAKILLKIKKGCLNKIPLKILKFYGVKEIISLIGEFDLMLHVKVNSFKDFHYLINRQLKPFDEILDLKVQFVDKIVDKTN